MHTTCYDVAIIGGGPAGSTAATLLARKGRKVVVLERDTFPRFQIGESLLPFSTAIFEKLGISDKLNERFIVKRGAEIHSGCGKRKIKFLFKNSYGARYPTAYHVPRAEFDKLLLDHAAENGVEVREATAVTRVDLARDQVALGIESGAPARAGEITARWVIDCSGRNSVVGNHLKLRRNYNDLRKIAVYAHFERKRPIPGVENDFTRMVRARDYWFWFIPLNETLISIGVVMDVERFKQLKTPPEQLLDEEFQRLAMTRELPAYVERVSKVYTSGDYSFRNSAFWGDRWTLAGDAAGFVDPVFSTGVCMAFEAADLVAEAVHLALDDPKRGARELRKYSRRMNQVMDVYLRIVRRWYQPHFPEVFLTETSRLGLIRAVTSILAGNAIASFAVRWRMEVFYALVALQKRFAICPRIEET